MTITEKKISTIELHYEFTDKEHRIDAFIQNECERAFLALAKEVISYLDIQYTIETELTKEGGIRKYFNFKPKTISEKDLQKSNIEIRTQIAISIIVYLLLAPISAGVTGIVNNAINNAFANKELTDLDIQIKEETLKKLKLENQEKQEEIENNKIIRKSKSDFFEALSSYTRLDGITIIQEDDEKNIINENTKILRVNFDDYIFTDEDLSDEFIESVPIVLISPILDSKRNKAWMGIYNGETVNLHIKSEDFITSVDEGLIEFKHGFIMTCNIRIESKKLKNGNISKKNIVTEVINYIIDNKLCETLEGKRYKQKKDFEKGIQELDFGE